MKLIFSKLYRIATHDKNLPKTCYAFFLMPQSNSEECECKNICKFEQGNGAIVNVNIQDKLCTQTTITKI